MEAFLEWYNYYDENIEDEVSYELSNQKLEQSLLVVKSNTTRSLSTFISALCL